MSSCDRKLLYELDLYSGEIIDKLIERAQDNPLFVEPVLIN
ncbi:MAG: hypothetical protein ACR2O7_09930 [Parasphingorhabdus sp.]